MLDWTYEYLLNSEDGKEFVDELKIPEGFRQIHAIALGYKNNNLVNTPERREKYYTYIKIEHKNKIDLYHHKSILLL